MGLPGDGFLDPFGAGAGKQLLVLDRVLHAVHDQQSAHGIGVKFQTAFGPHMGDCNTSCLECRGKQQATEALDWFLASWARRLSWKETATVFGVSWDRVYRAVGMAVAWGRERVSLEGVTTIGVDEIAWQRGKRSSGAG